MRNLLRTTDAARLQRMEIKENGAGSGTLVPPSSSQRGEGNISNQRVLSDMGLAILMK